MNTLQLNQFFSLLRSGIGVENGLDLSLFEQNCDWDALFLMATEQTVAALMWDGIAKLPSELQPRRELKLRWYYYAQKVEETNKIINSVVISVFELLEKEGLEPVLFKGAAVATLYSNPLHRGCGDIDLYIGSDQYERAREILIEAGGVDIDHHNEKHCGIEYKSILVELHKVLIVLPRGSKNRILSQKIDFWYKNRQFSSVEIDGKQIRTAPNVFNTEYLFLHLTGHLTAYGVGLRQVCDLLKAIEKWHKECENIELTENIEIWKTLTSVYHKYFGISETILPHFDPKYNPKADTLVELMMSEGNFGHHAQSAIGRPKGHLQGKLFAMKNQLIRWVKIYKLFPNYPFFAAFTHRVSDNLEHIFKK